MISRAAANGIGKGIDSVQESGAMNTSGIVPSKPVYMKIVDSFSGSPMTTFVASAGLVAVNVATFQSASWSAKTNKVVAGVDGQSFDMCVFSYSGGHQRDIYGELVTEGGGTNLPLVIARSVAHRALGSPKEFMDQVFADTLDSIYAAVRPLRTSNSRVVSRRPARCPGSVTLCSRN